MATFPMRTCLLAGLPLLLQAFLLPATQRQTAFSSSHRSATTVTQGTQIRSKWKGGTLHPRTLFVCLHTHPSPYIFSPFKVHNLDGVEIPGPLNPLANVLLVKVKDAADMSAGGIVLPDQVHIHAATLIYKW